ncbi:cupin domain-containing protein [Azospirillum sp. BE72]|uniref:(R)-mandelonitrile lyase n=1 Tax=Azospirillum sp. BE72 TaxID=2817776 RepID=UPI002864DE47|nr:cupin domain-containing protein [Azospirillum sp. BE72]MDR6774085.1 quercetin dioxygenase-like cupin family protein [Azospirillum sp. BE72]
MKLLSASTISVGLLCSPVSADEAIRVMRPGSQASSYAPSENFTGTVRRDSAFKGTGSSRIVGGINTFEAGARTAWHTHPAGQTLIVTMGHGIVQQEGNAKQDIRPGDIVWIPANVRHWHGASAITAMSHIAINEMVDGSPVTWMEHVTNDQYFE